MLIGVADALRTATRPRDVVARVGGDEFAIILEDVRTEQISQIAERVRASVAALRVGPDESARSTVSIGAIVIDGTLDVLELNAAADDALYVAKRRRDSIELYLEPRLAVSPEDDANLIVMRLRRALSINTLAVQYQGVRSVEDGALYCEEALARISSEGASSRAAEFVSLAARTGVIGEIDRRVTNLVLDRLDESWPARLSLNLSAASLTDSDPLAVLRKRAPSNGYNQRLILEAREPDLLADPGRAARWADAVHELGAMVAIDDFSATKPALGMIATLPTDLVKIDRSIIASLTEQVHAARLQELLSACRDRGVVVVAKRIQDAAMLDTLPRIGITLAQGFLIDAPHAVIGLVDVLETAEEFGAVSAGLVAWEFMVLEPAVGLVWRRALDEQLLSPRHTDPETGEAMFALTGRGKARLRELRAHRDRFRE
jgi:EAL domain-containing protein (putative c-di-GMP-specific phosphodiesterase class I)